MNLVLVSPSALHDVEGHRGPQPRGPGEAGRETSVPRPAERPVAETRVSARAGGRAGGAHTGPLPCRLPLDPPLGPSPITLILGYLVPKAALSWAECVSSLTSFPISLSLTH